MITALIVLFTIGMFWMGMRALILYDMPELAIGYFILYFICMLTIWRAA